MTLVDSIVALAPEYAPHVRILGCLPVFQLEAWYERLRYAQAGGSGDIWDGEWDAQNEHQRRDKKRY